MWRNRSSPRVGANASLEDIAKKAGVGPGTLYRHFPMREDLLVAVYRSEMEKLAAAERTLAESKSPVEALRAWLLLLVDAVETKQIIAPVLNTLVGDADDEGRVNFGCFHPYSCSRRTSETAWAAYQRLVGTKSIVPMRIFAD